MDRVSFLMHVKDGYQDEYIRRHREVWPEVLADQQRAGIKKMAIYMNGSDLFLYMEVEDYAKAVQLLSQSPASIRWEEYMAPIMESDDDQAYDPANAFPASLPEVFYWESPTRDGNRYAPAIDNGNSHVASPPHFGISPGSAVNL